MPFNPYLRWLGIRDTESPPNHYKLLGVELFETDADVIATAADRQMAHVRRYQNGPHSAVSQKVLNELAVAKLCLLDERQRRTYDEHLKARLPNLLRPLSDDPPGNTPALPAGHPATSQKTLTADHRNANSAAGIELPAESITSIEDAQAAADRLRRARPKSGVNWYIGAGLLLLLAAIPAVRFLAREIPPDLSGGLIERSTGPAKHAEPPRKADRTAVQPITIAQPDDQPATGDINRHLPTATDQPGKPMGDQGTSLHPHETGTNSKVIPEISSPSETESEDMTTDSPVQLPSHVEPASVDPGAAAQLILPPIPTDYQLKKVREQFDQTYASRIETALATPESREAAAKLAGELYLEGVRADQAVDKYVLLTQSMALAIRAGQTALTNSAADQLSGSFDIDPVTIRCKIAQQTADDLLAAKERTTPGDNAAFCTAVTPMIETAFSRDDFEQAKQLLKLLSFAARKARTHSAAHESAVAALRADWTARKKKFNQVELARTRLLELASQHDSVDRGTSAPSRQLTGSSSPASKLADAHWTIAQYEAFTKSDFPTAAPHFIASGHPQLATIGSQELDVPSTPQDQRNLGLLWWDFANQAKLRGNRPMVPAVRTAALRRAHEWLSIAVTELTGLEKSATEQSLATVLSELEAVESNGSAAQPALVFNGRTSYLSVPTFRYDGQRPIRIEVLIKPASPTAGHGTNASIVSNASPTGGFTLAAAGGYWRFTFANHGGPPLVVQAKQRLMSDAWTRLVAAYDGSVISLQVDDNTAITARSSAAHRASAFPLMIAASPNRDSNSAKEFYLGALAALTIHLTTDEQRPALELTGVGTADTSPYHHDIRAVHVERRAK